MIPRARLRAPLWRRLLAWLRARRIRSSCAFCSRFPTLSPHTIKILHAAHCDVDRVARLVHEMPMPGDGVPRA